MTEQGLILFFDKANGNKLLRTPSQKGPYVVPWTVEYLIAIYPELRERDRELTI